MSSLLREHKLVVFAPSALQASDTVSYVWKCLLKHVHLVTRETKINTLDERYIITNVMFHRCTVIMSTELHIWYREGTITQIFRVTK